MSYLHKSFIPALIYMIWFGLILSFDRRDVGFLLLTGVVATAVTYGLVRLFPGLKPKKPSS